jgi:hypothetical protein
MCGSYLRVPASRVKIKLVFESYPCPSLNLRFRGSAPVFTRRIEPQAAKRFPREGPQVQVRLCRMANLGSLRSKAIVDLWRICQTTNDLVIKRPTRARVSADVGTKTKDTSVNRRCTEKEDTNPLPISLVDPPGCLCACVFAHSKHQWPPLQPVS